MKDIRRILPRETRLGPPAGFNWKSDVLGETTWIHKRFHKDIVAADTEIGT